MLDKCIDYHLKKKFRFLYSESFSNVDVPAETSFLLKAHWEQQQTQNRTCVQQLLLPPRAATTQRDCVEGCVKPHILDKPNFKR